ncbi:hypothetical protein CVT24_011182 [Panaeolus cyanescens]|uniref:Uncharacterized protein n=1 Tax=Panaeolus cyanescens TaxID=181874 RepID=A0A409YGE2_9AGAR|nr:hypothetical protein CVT24_011182 [Panaeolus cyanescens]
MKRNLTAIFSLCIVFFSYINVVGARPGTPPAEITFVYTPYLTEALRLNPSWGRRLDFIQKTIQTQLQEIRYTIDEYDSPRTKRRARAKQYLKTVLGEYYDRSSERRARTFQHILSNIEHMDSTITLDGPMKPRVPDMWVDLGSGGRIYLAQGFFTDPTLEDWFRVYMLLRETFRATIPQYAQKFALGRYDGRTGSAAVRPLFPGQRIASGETEVNGYTDYRQILKQRTGADVFPYSPDLIPLMGYCFTNKGEMPVDA